jgi:hypothetical protein
MVGSSRAATVLFRWCKRLDSQELPLNDTQAPYYLLPLINYFCLDFGKRKPSRIDFWKLRLGAALIKILQVIARLHNFKQREIHLKPSSLT